MWQMKTKLTLTMGAIIAALLLLTGCNSDNPDQERETPYTQISMSDATRAVVAPSNDFALDLFRLAAAVNRGNIVISPISISNVLSMVANADSGESRDEILFAVGLPAGQQGLDILNEYNRLMLSTLPTLDGKTICNIANSVWTEFPLNRIFAENMVQYLGAELFRKSPRGENGRQAINKWVSTETSGIIPEFLKNPIDASWALVNASYFKGIWANPFDREETTGMTFHNLDLSETRTPFMYVNADFSYNSFDDFEIVSLPYGNGNFCMEVILPAEGKFADVMGTLTAETLEAARREARSCDIVLRLPKFESGFATDLIPLFGKLGINGMFSSLDQLMDSDKVAATYACHAVKIKIDEEGTEAASATMVGGVTANLTDTVVMTVDRPFIYLIRETSTGVLLFAGTQVAF